MIQNEERALKLAERLKTVKSPLNILLELLSMLNTGNEATIEIAQLALFAYLDSLRKTAPHQAMGSIIQALRTECDDDTPAAEFLDNAYKAYELILEEAYKKTLRTLTGSYKTDGSIKCCPKCNSNNVYEGENSMYEFTHMICSDCGNEELADDYQIEDWYKAV